MISADQYGDKVLLRSDGLVLKLFRRKRLISSATIWPYAKRFARAAKRLRDLGVTTVDVSAVYRVRSIGRDVVVYRHLDGEPLRGALADAARTQALLGRFTGHLVQLHGQGVYFRSIHFGNVIVLANGGFGLIDVSETRFSRGALNPRKRARNFKHLLRYSEDVAALQQFGTDQFVRNYLEHVQLSNRQQRQFLHRLSRSHPVLRDAVHLIQQLPSSSGSTLHTSPT